MAGIKCQAGKIRIARVLAAGFAAKLQFQEILISALAKAINFIVIEQLLDIYFCNFKVITKLIKMVC